MKRFSQLQEERGERAFKQAMSMGLKYGGFGYWKDPQTNETVYKTENDTLVKVEPREESELAAKGGPDDGSGRPDAMGGGMAAGGGGGMAGAAGMLQMPGGGQAGAGILGTGEPGAAKVGKEHGWEPGPDGDTCVGPEAEEPGDVPEDSFVGRTNFLKWKAGPDGDNINTVSLGMVKEEIRQIKEAEFNKDRRQHIQNVKNFAAGNNSNPGTETKNDVMLAQGKGATWLKSYLGRVAKNAGVTPDSTQTNTPPHLKSSKFNPLSDTTIKTSSTGTVPKTSSYYDYDDDEPTPPSWIDGGAPEVRRADRRLVDKMNASTKEMVKDADYDLDQYDDRDPIASGAFGSFTLGDDGVGVKTGNIGPGELAALFAMRDNPHFPTLINARFDGPFINQSSAYNNPENDPDMHRRSDGNYFDPKTAQTWDKRFPGAWGKYAMSIANGEPVASAWYDMSPEMKQKAMRSFWEARGDLHKAGFSHNDMHGGNVMVDPETGEVSILDLGLAEDNPTSAIMEALGGLDFEEGNDYQLAHQLSGSNLPQEVMDRITDRRIAFEEGMMDNYDGDPDDEEGYDNALSVLSSVMNGNIRMDKEELEKITSIFPKLGDGEFVKERIAELYDGLWDTEYPEDAEREEPKPGGLMGNKSRVDSVIDKMRGKGQLGTGASGAIRKAMGIDHDD
jgi:hypothetical protein